MASRNRVIQLACFVVLVLLPTQHGKADSPAVDGLAAPLSQSDATDVVALNDSSANLSMPISSSVLGTAGFDGQAQHYPLWRPFHFFHSDPDDPARHTPFGQPLLGTSWRNRPLHADVFAGSLLLENLDGGDIEQANGLFTGIRLGHDFDHFWGNEIRLGLAEGRLTAPEVPTYSGTSQVILLDYAVQFYPWGDSRWRPYTTVGIGTAIFDYEDISGRSRNRADISLPIGLGIKSRIHPRLAFRLEFLDNITLGDDPDGALNNLSLTAGFEYRWGTNTPSYFR